MRAREALGVTQPNLFIVGAPKCGTTSLARWLGRHQDVFLPSEKEPHHYNSDEKHRFYPEKDSYLALYAEGAELRYRIDASTWYLHSEVAVQRILRDSPEAKFLVCLRNPVDMAFSLHRHLLNKTARENVSSFRKAWNLSEKRNEGLRVSSLVSEPRYLAYKYSCRIGSQTERLLHRVPEGQVFVVLFDDLIERPEVTLAGVLDFLDLDADMSFSLGRENDGKTYKYPALRRFVRRLFRAASALKVGFGLGQRVRSFASRVNPEVEKSRMSDEDRKMVTEYFVEEIFKVWALSGSRREEWLDCLEAETLSCMKGKGADVDARHPNR